MPRDGYTLRWVRLHDREDCPECRKSTGHWPCYEMEREMNMKLWVAMYSCEVQFGKPGESTAEIVLRVTEACRKLTPLVTPKEAEEIAEAIHP